MASNLVKHRIKKCHRNYSYAKVSYILPGPLLMTFYSARIPELTS